MIESAADTLAQNDVDSNKQSYANSQGKCNCSGSWSYNTNAYHETESQVSELRFGIAFKWTGACSPVITTATIKVFGGGMAHDEERTVSIPTSWSSGHEYIFEYTAPSPEYGYRFGCSVVINSPTGTTC